MRLLITVTLLRNSDYYCELTHIAAVNLCKANAIVFDYLVRIPGMLSCPLCTKRVFGMSWSQRSWISANSIWQHWQYETYFFPICTATHLFYSSVSFTNEVFSEQVLAKYSSKCTTFHNKIYLNNKVIALSTRTFMVEVIYLVT